VADGGLLERLLAAQRRFASDVLLEIGVYSPAGSIGDIGRLEERPDQLGHALDFCELGFDSVVSRKRRSSCASIG
jgi:hypothetical protein